MSTAPDDMHTLAACDTYGCSPTTRPRLQPRTHALAAPRAYGCRYDEDAPEAGKVPDYEERLDTFERLLLLRALREDRTLLCVQRYVVEVLGARYADSRPLDWRLIEEEAHCRTPIIALLSQGADPTAAIAELAKRRKRTVRTISMGQGQEPAARKLIATGVGQGSWVMLQNCHLGLSFMAEVEQTLRKLEEARPEPRDGAALTAAALTAAALTAAALTAAALAAITLTMATLAVAALTVAALTAATLTVGR